MGLQGGLGGRFRIEKKSCIISRVKSERIGIGMEKGCKEEERQGRKVTVRQFAARHGLWPETWRRERLRGETGVAGS